MHPHPPRSAVARIAWPALVDPVGAVFLSLQHQLDQSERAPPERVRARQLRQLDRLLRHAHAAIPFYRDRLTAAGYAPDRALTAELWAGLPLLRRAEVQAAEEAVRSATVPAGHGKTFIDSTSGSTGRPLRVLKTELTTVLFNAVTLRNHLWHARDLKARLAIIRRDRSGRSWHPDGSSQPLWGFPTGRIFETGRSLMLDIRCSIAQQIDWLQRQEPAYLNTFPSNLDLLARHAREHGAAIPSLRQLSTFGELVTPDLREACRDAFGVAIADIYSSVETGYIALQCPADDSLYHVQAEVALVEILDPAGNPCSPGEAGEVVVTPLHNFATPLIRYAIGDFAVPGGPCGCGRTLPTLARIMGRTRNAVVLPDGRRRWATVGPKKLAKIHAVRQIQVVQHTVDDIEVKLVVARPLEAGEEARIRSNIQEDLGHPFPVRFSYHAEIPLGPGGKYEDFVSEVPP
jgi:phenylacetate-CoA ligase